MKRLLYILFALGAYCTNALALIHVQGGGAYETINLEQKTILDSAAAFSGIAAEVSLDLDPIPVIPIGFGIGLNASSLSGKVKLSGDSTKEFDAEMAGFNMDFHAQVWSPVSLGGITPFIQGGYVFYGKQALSMKKAFTEVLTNTEFDKDFILGNTGLLFGAGIRISLLPLIKIVAHYNMRQNDFEVEEYKNGLIKVTAATDAFSGVKHSFGLSLNAGI